MADAVGQSGRLDLNQRPLGPQPASDWSRCVPERPQRPHCPRRWMIWTHRTLHSVPKRYHRAGWVRIGDPLRFSLPRTDQEGRYAWRRYSRSRIHADGESRESAACNVGAVPETGGGMTSDDLSTDLDAFDQFEASAWEERVEGYADFPGAITGRPIEPLLNLARVGPGTRVLDVATGPATWRRKQPAGGLPFGPSTSPKRWWPGPPQSIRTSNSRGRTRSHSRSRTGPSM